MSTAASQIVSQRRSSVAGASCLAHAARAGILAAGLLAAFASAPAAAAEASWKAGCAYKMPSGIPGVGHTIIAEACRHLTECETMAGQRRPNMMEMGCFGYAPALRRN